ncbi:N-alpha-acetyltransferase 80-like, partial [Saccoglossus kowalevskii]
VVDKKRRGEGLGRKLMDLTEEHARNMGSHTMYLCTKDKQDFYQHLGYKYCDPVNTLAAQMLETCDCPMIGCDDTSSQGKTSCST